MTVPQLGFMLILMFILIMKRRMVDMTANGQVANCYAMAIDCFDSRMQPRRNTLFSHKPVLVHDAPFSRREKLMKNMTRLHLLMTSKFHYVRDSQLSCPVAKNLPLATTVLLCCTSLATKGKQDPGFNCQSRAFHDSKATFSSQH